MTKDEFKALFNGVIAEYNTNHGVEIVVVIVKHDGTSNVHTNVCLTHGVCALAALSSVLADRALVLSKDHIADEIATAALEDCPQRFQGEQGS